MNVQEQTQLTNGILDAVSKFLQPVMESLSKTFQISSDATTSRREIIHQTLESYFNMDTNKNANTGYVVVMGIAVIALLAYKFVTDTKKK